MDQSLLIQAGASATTISIILILYKIYQAVNHHRLRSQCCGYKLDASIDVEETTPKEKAGNEIVTVKPLEINGTIKPN
jgi:hypothetical protein